VFNPRFEYSATALMRMKSTRSPVDDSMKPLIDIDDRTTWPPHVYQIVSKWAEQCAGKTNYTNDLPLRIDLEAPFQKQFEGYLVRAYHYTRLLPHERPMVLSQGLRRLSADLLTERIESARAAGAISAVEAEIFHKTHVFAAGEEEHREGQVCLVLSERLFERDSEACLPLLTSWGGEALYRSSGSVPFRERLKTLGVPTRVVGLLEIEDASKHKVYPALHRVFVGSFLGLMDVGADVFYRAPVPPEYIERIEEIDGLDTVT
jgi:hypothetical protein